MSSKQVSKQEELRKRIYNFYIENRSQGKKHTVNHFKKEKVPSSTIYSIIDRAENESGHQRASGSGRVAKIMTPTAIRQLTRLFDHKCGISQRQAARKFKCSQPYVNQTIKRKTNIKCRAKKIIPDRTEAQKAAAKIRCGRLYRTLQNLAVIMDDESYFTLAHSTINGNGLFYSSNVEQTSANVKYVAKSKYPQKLLVWIAISECGLSEPFFVPSKTAVNQFVYLGECLEKRLVPFIRQHHPDGQYIFYPDLASSHYAQRVVKWYNDNSINYVKKAENPANCPEVRPIENFWSILKGKVYESNWKANNLKELEVRIRFCLSKIDQNLVKRLIGDTRRLVGQVWRNGVIENQ